MGSTSSDFGLSDGHGGRINLMIVEDFVLKSTEKSEARSHRSQNDTRIVEGNDTTTKFSILMSNIAFVDSVIAGNCSRIMAVD